MKVQKVELKYFKFHKNLTIEFDDKSLLIYGENGTGKSSIYEALYSNFYHQKRLDKGIASNIQETYKSRRCEADTLKVNVTFNSGNILNRSGEELSNLNILRLKNGSEFIEPTIYFANEKVLNRLTKENFYIALKDTLVEHFPNLKLIEKIFREKNEEVRRWKNEIIHQQKQPLKEGEQVINYDEIIDKYKTQLIYELKVLNNVFKTLFDIVIPKKTINEIIKEKFDESFSISFDIKDAEIPTTLENIGLDFEINFPIIKIKIDEVECNGKLSNHFNEAKLKLIGVAIYFALAKKYKAENGGFKLLVLDDFLTSLDMANRKLIMKYILEEFKEYQKLILTHNLQFFNMARKMINLDSEEAKQWKVKKLFVYDDQASLCDKDISYLKDASERLSSGDEHSAGNFIRKEFERIVAEFEQLLELGRVEDLQNIIDALKSNDKHYIDSHKVTNRFYAGVQKILDDSTKNEQIKISCIKSAFKPLNKTEIEFTEKIQHDDGTTSNETIKALIKRGEFYKNFILNSTSHDDTEAEIYRKECENAIKILQYLNKVITDLKGTKYE